MTRLRASKMASAVLLVCTASAIASVAQTFTTLVDLDGTNGANPFMSLVQGRDGALYGTTAFGGIDDYYGTVFKITHRGELTSIYRFCAEPRCTDGAHPGAGLVLAGDGIFYGTTLEGGSQSAGTVFKVTPSGALTTLHSFDSADGAHPAGLVLASDGNFYGTTSLGGTQSGGTVFKMSPAGTLTTLYSFCMLSNCADGQYPLARLVQAANGNFYGTTYQGGTNGQGTVFKVTRGGKLTTLYSFCGQANCADGQKPAAELVQASDGTFYGTTDYGGANYNFGTVFNITLRGALKTIYNFDSTDGGYPTAGLVQATDGTFFGTTGDGAAYGYGSLFKMTSEGTLTILHNFNYYDGAAAYGSLVQATDGNLYGTTYFGGINNDGTVFRLDVELSPFVSFIRAAGRVGQTGGILGQGFTGTTGVSLNGTPASFTVVSDTFLKATVPVGATTGYVTVTTPSGTLTSNVPFHVIR